MLTLLSILLLGAAEAHAAGKVTKVFTALGADSRGHVVVGVMRRTGGFDPFAKLLSINPKTFKRVEIALPRDAYDREVIAIIRGSKQLLVLTQQTVEQGDNPSLYAYNPRSKKWTRIGEVACPVIEKARAEQDRLEFQCEKETESGSFISAKEILPLKNDTVVFPGELEINAQTVKTPTGVSAALEGEEDARTQVRIKSGKIARVIKP